ncbi:MAG: T9SS type A sorting domain-containing protein [Chitinophagales bacterium]|nr:T9SS type A sorting domain-containing protein [Chitinophagales bacterium]
MKKFTLTSFLLFNFLIGSFAQHRYVDPIFSGTQITSNITYGQNISVLLGGMQDLKMDVYEPVGDTLAQRPLIVYMHPGDFLPIVCNGGVNGDLHDSAVVEMCKQFARRGYVVANIDYRLGWLPLNPNQDCRKGSLYQAVYRGLQDAKTCVRYFKMNAAVQGNSYKIDTGKIVVGGQGSAGYISTAYAALNQPSELLLPQFISSSTDASCGSTTGQPFIVESVLGDFDGFGGLPQYNNPNWPGYSSKVEMVFNMEGGMGDTSWMQQGEVPMVSFHDVNNPLAPYDLGNVFVPLGDGTILLVTEVAGSHLFIKRANELGNNNIFHIGWTDPYTTRANRVDDGYTVNGFSREGLFPIVQPDPSLFIPGDPYHGQTSPWEWWNCADLEKAAPFCGQTPGFADTVCGAGFYTNPNMSKTKALNYIDTVQYYLDERICLALGLCSGNVIGINEASVFKAEVNLFPNPASQVIHLNLNNTSLHFLAVRIYDIEGRKVYSEENLYRNSLDINCDQFRKGSFIIHTQTEKGNAAGKLVID